MPTLNLHDLLSTKASKGSDVACKCLGTHTGDMDDGIGSYYTAPEAADNVTDEVSVGYRKETTAITYVDNLALA